jgi:hypothetical protein
MASTSFTGSGEHCKAQITTSVFYAKITSTNDLRAAHAAMWARSFDAHDIFVVASQADAYSDYYINLYHGGILVWKPLESLPISSNPPNHRQETEYRDELEDKPILDTLRRAFDAMAALLTGEEV